MKRLLIATLITTLLGGILTTPASAAYTVKPKVGQCFLYSAADVSAPHPRKNPVSCSGTHNAETYLVTKWPIKTNPADAILATSKKVRLRYATKPVFLDVVP